MSSKIIILYSFFACVILFLLENIFKLTYLYGVFTKLVFFAIIPLIFQKFSQKNILKIGKISKKSIKNGIFFGILGGIIIFLAYFFLKDAINWGDIKKSMEARSITKSTFLVIFAYIMFGNSFLEEYFFRAIVFFNAKKINKIFAYIFSSILFSAYHLFIFSTWFSGYLMLVALFGLFLGGLFFAWLYEKTDGTWGAWIFHIIADLVIVLVGYFVFFS